MRYGSVCSGIEAATVAWAPLGWEAAFFAEIEKFPCAVLQHYYPGVVNLGNMTKIREDVPHGRIPGPIDVLVGGTPCQSFSVAGLRGGMADPRGNLALAFLGIADALRPQWVVWENVPGVLSSGKGRDFGSFLGALGELGYGWAYRVLDAQYWGLAQRRKRVFVVARLGDWRGAAAVLFERESLSGDPAPGRETRKDVAPSLSSRPSAGGGPGTDFDLDGGLIPQVAGTIGGNNRTGGHRTTDNDLAGAFLPIPIQEVGKRTGKSTDDPRTGIGDADPGAPMYTLQAGAQHGVAYGNNHTEGPQDVAGGIRAKGGSGHGDFESETFVVAPTLRSGSVGPKSHNTANPDSHPMVVGSLRANGFDASEDGTGRQPLVINAMQDPICSDEAQPLGVHGNAQAVIETLRSHPFPGSNSLGSLFGVRRLTPREWERLQGFPDDYTLIPYGGKGKMAKDSPRYKAIGNSMPVPVMRWIGRRIQAVVDLG